MSFFRGELPARFQIGAIKGAHPAGGWAVGLLVFGERVLGEAIIQLRLHLLQFA